MGRERMSGGVRRLLRAAALGSCLLAAGCAGGAFQEGAPRLGSADRGRVQFAMLDAVNALRAAQGSPALQLDPALTAAAATHSRDMAAQNRPWHFGSDGSSPPQRAARAGYAGAFRGEAISESFETELETLGAWMEDPAARDVVLDPVAREMGLAWHQERTGKVWWTLLTGTPELPATVPVAVADLLPAPPPEAVIAPPIGATIPPAPETAPAGFPIERSIAPPGASPPAPPPGLRG
jgi:uncharacterized protein YkwD